MGWNLGKNYPPRRFSCGQNRIKTLLQQTNFGLLMTILTGKRVGRTSMKLVDFVVCFTENILIEQTSELLLDLGES